MSYEDLYRRYFESQATLLRNLSKFARSQNQEIRDELQRLIRRVEQLEKRRGSE